MTDGNCTLHWIERVEGDSPIASIIFLHGLGGNAQILSDLVVKLGLPVSARWLFPQAPVRPVRFKNDMLMPAWYDVYGDWFGTKEDEVGLKEAARQINQLIEREMQRGMPVIIGGFSQGGALALYTGLRYPKRLAGLVSLSGYLPVADQLKQEANSANRQVEIFIANGEQDSILAFEIGQASVQKLQELNYSVDFHRYPMGHTISAFVLMDLALWLKKQLSTYEYNS